MSRATALLEGGVEALERGDRQAAREAFPAALAEGDLPEARDGLGRTLWWLGDVDGAIHHREAAYAAFRRRGEVARAVGIALWLAREHLEALWNRPASDGWMARAEGLLPEVPDDPVHGWFALARAGRAEEHGEMRRLAAEALEAGRRLRDPDLEVAALARLGYAEVAAGEVTSGTAKLDEALAAATGGEVASDDPDRRVSCCPAVELTLSLSLSLQRYSSRPPRGSGGVAVQTRRSASGSRRSIAPLLMLASSIASMGCGRIAAGEGPGPSGVAPPYVTVSTGPPAAPMPFVSGSTIVGLSDAPIQLDATPAGGSMGWLAPVAVPSPDGRAVAYSTFDLLVPIDPERSFSEQGIHPGDAIATPSIRLVDLSSGADDLLAEGAFSVAWRADGALAYFQGQTREYRANEPFLGNVVVRASPGAAPEPWTERPGRYVVAAWAGTRLLVYRRSEGEWLDLLVLDGPGRSRTLAPGASLVAVSPDGSQALVSQQGEASLLDIQTGAALATLSLDDGDAASGTPLRYLAYGGSWVGDLVAAEGGPGLVLLRVSDRQISVTDTIALPPKAFPMPPHEPRLNPDGSRVVAWTPLPGPAGRRLYSYLECTVPARSCVAGPAADVGAYYAVYNASRPLPPPGSARAPADSTDPQHAPRPGAPAGATIPPCRSTGNRGSSSAPTAWARPTRSSRS